MDLLGFSRSPQTLLDALKSPFLRAQVGAIEPRPDRRIILVWVASLSQLSPTATSRREDANNTGTVKMVCNVAGRAHRRPRDRRASHASPAAQLDLRTGEVDQGMTAQIVVLPSW